MSEELNDIKIVNRKLFKQNFFIEQIFKLNIIKDKIEHIQENIASARNGILQPNVLNYKTQY